MSDEQRDVIDYLSSPAAHDGAPVERIETHASIVFLAGRRAWKLKRAVRYDYLDFSTAARRKTMCEAELRINRRTAPALYRRVVPVTREGDGGLVIDGRGTPVDWLIEMARFDQAALFDRLAARGALDLAWMPALGAAIAHFHEAAERRPEHGGDAGIAWVIDGNALGFAQQGAGILDPAGSEALTRAARRALADGRRRLEARRRDGFVRQCHGDLHLRNIVLIDGRPTLFDAVEFNDEIACIDVLYDLAFLLMDLWRRDLPRHANAAFNAYLAETTDFSGLALLPLFLSCRAAVRAKTSATSVALQTDAQRGDEFRALARAYAAMAAELLQPLPACAVAVGGFSGSGKSTLARTLAPSVGAVPGAVIVRSDETRKRLFGVDPLVPLGTAAYAPEVNDRVYKMVIERARTIVAAGHTVIVDAVFARAADREAIERAVAGAGVPFVGIWLDAPPPTLIERVEHRGPDASDADSLVVDAQLAQDIGVVSWPRIDASAGSEQVGQRAAQVLNTTCAQPRLRGV